MEAALSKAAPDCCFKHVSVNFLYANVHCMNNIATTIFLPHGC